MPALSRAELLALAHKRAQGQLAHGQLSAIAKEAGVTPSALAQATASQEAILREGTEAAVAPQPAHDSKYDSIEFAALEKMEKLLAVETNIMKVMKIAEFTNSAKRRAAALASASGTSASGATFVTINMPTAIQQRLVLNENKEVIEVEGRSLVTMPSMEVEELLAAQKSKAEEEQLPTQEKSLLDILEE